MKNEFRLTSGNSIILDLIRGFTAQVVVFGHGISFFGIFMFMQEPYSPWVQDIAVLIFFILSGFLITYSTVNKIRHKEGYSFKHFFIDRFSRIFTAFVPSLIFVVSLDFISRQMQNTYMYENAFNLKTFFGNLLMLQDFPLFKVIPSEVITSFGSARPFWTLAIEWWIYLFFGYFLLVTIRNKATLLNLITLIFFAIVPLFNLVSGRGDGLTVYWIFGALIYLLLNQNILHKIKKSIKIIMLMLTIGLANFRVMKTINSYEPIFAFLIAISILLIVDLFKYVKFSDLTTKIIRVNANYSYTLYLIHYSVLDFIFTHYFYGYNSYILLVIGFISSNIISFLIGYYTETKLTYSVKKILYNKFT